VRLIILYKMVKGTLGVALAVILGVLLLLHDGTAPLTAFAAWIRHHFVGAWSVHVVELVMSLASPSHVALVAVALLIDGIFTLLEGFALRSGRWWGPWLVVLATSTLIPFEVAAFVKHLRVGRALIIVVNTVVVVYLARRALREHRAKQMVAERLEAKEAPNSGSRSSSPT
jgi:uncharacterized membrane protein (DUF2068 family)